MLKFPIKATRVNNLTDARYFAALEVNWLGFDLNQGTPDFVDPSLVKAIAEWVSGPLITGEFDWQETNDLADAINLLGLQAIQVGPLVDVQELAKKTDASIIRVFVVDQKNNLAGLDAFIAESKDAVENFLIDFEKNGISFLDLSTGHLDQLRKLGTDHDLIFNFKNFELQHVDQFQKLLPDCGLQLAGGDEEKVGLKSFDELDQIMDLIIDEN